MKFKKTQKAIKAVYTNVIKVGYCCLQFLLSRESPSAYTVRREGWGSDVYTFGNVAISTGYAPFGNIKADYDTCTKYEQAASAIRSNYDLSWGEQRDRLRKLIEKFIDEVAASK